MSKVVLLSRTRNNPRSGNGYGSTSNVQLSLPDTDLFMSRSAELQGARVQFELDEFCIPNTFAEVTGNLILDEQGVGTASIPLSGYFTYTAFASYLKDALDAASPGGLVYTVTYSAYPFASYTISTTSNFRFNLARPVPDVYFLSDVSVYLGLTPGDYLGGMTPYALSISSTKSAILNVNTHILLSIKPITSNSVMTSPPGVTPVNFAYMVPVDANKTEYIRYRPNNQFKQKISFLNVGTENYASWTVQIYRADGSFFTDLADWTATLGYSLLQEEE